MCIILVCEIEHLGQKTVVNDAQTFINKIA